MTPDPIEPEVPDFAGRRYEESKLNAILRILNELPEPSQVRILRYLADRYVERTKEEMS